MAHVYELTNEDIQALIALIEDGNTQVLGTGAVEKLAKLHLCVSDKLAKLTAASQKKQQMLQMRLDRRKEEKTRQAESGQFAESGLDSMEVALALLYQLQQLKTYQLSRNKLIYILFAMYSSWLASKQERLFAEHPCATEWGPQFWRVYKRTETVKSPVEASSFTALAEKRPDIAAFCRNAAQKYYDYGTNTLKEMYLKIEPYEKAKAENNGGKWNKEINDTDIYLWKNSQKNNK